MKWRILVVDDESDVRLIIKTTLEPKYEVVEAHDGLDALEKMERYEPDFVLMDVMMPLMNGHEACAAIRKNPKFKNLPVMFLSALGSKEEIRKGYQQGANLYLTKPFDPPRLMRNIDMHFQEAAAAPPNRRYSLDEIKTAEAEGKLPVAPGSHEFERPASMVDNQRLSATEQRISRPSASQPAVPKPPATGASTYANALDSEGVPLPARVMVVDDDSEIVALIRMSLDGIAEVVWAHDGLDAIEKLVKYQPDILVIDVMLPKMNGFQLCQSLRSNRAFARLPIMMCSAKSGDRDITFAKRLGANDYLTKPFSPAELISKVRELQKLPGFYIRPKAFAVEEIHVSEDPQEGNDIFDMDDQARVREEKRPTGMPPDAIQKFLNKEGKKEGLEHAPGAEPAADEKKKRRFFGWGRE